MSTSASTSTPSTLAAGSSAETQAAAFASDPRIHFDTQSQTWKLEDDNGDELEYDAGKGAWVPVVSTRLLVYCCSGSSRCDFLRVFRMRNLSFRRISFL